MFTKTNSIDMEDTIALHAPSSSTPRNVPANEVEDDALEDRTEQRCLVMIKPGAVARGLVGPIIAILNDTGALLSNIRMGRVRDESFIEDHYEQQKKKPFFPRLVHDMMSGPLVVIEYTAPEGARLIAKLRSVAGATDPLKAVPGTIRGRYGMDITHNVVHVSDSASAAEREIDMWFACNGAKDPFINKRGERGHERHARDLITTQEEEKMLIKKKG